MLNSEKISKIIEQEIKNFNKRLDVKEVGVVINVSDGIVKAYGLDNAMTGELVEFSKDTYGLVLNLEAETTGIVMLGDIEKVKEGDVVKRTKKIAKTPVGEKLMGRVINPLGFPLDGKEEIKAKEYKDIENIAPGIIDRQPVKEPLFTGIKAIDAMTPIGKGQRELIIGDRKTGKTAIALDTIINQKGKNVVCIYVAIGQKQSTVASIVNKLIEHDALDYTVILSATASQAASLLYLAPYSACAIGEYFRDKGKDALIVYDDLTKHAQAYRELSLLLRRPPGREAYPGDIFYCHSKLLERAAKLSKEKGGGSLTAFPIVETQAGDISSYIPTNVISITDGQIYLETGLFNSGQVPALNPGVSVSRVGGNAQTKIMKKVAGLLRLNLAQYRELSSFAKFSSDLDVCTKRQLERGKRLMEILKQEQYAPLSVEKQILIIYAVSEGFFDEYDPKDFHELEYEFYKFFEKSYKNLLKSLETEEEIDKSLEKKLKEAIESFKNDFKVHKWQL